MRKRILISAAAVLVGVAGSTVPAFAAQSPATFGDQRGAPAACATAPTKQGTVLCSWTETTSTLDAGDGAKTVKRMNERAVAAGRTAHAFAPARAGGRMSPDGADRMAEANRARLSPWARGVLAERGTRRAAASTGGVLDKCQRPMTIWQIDRFEACFSSFFHGKIFRNGIFKGEVVYKVTEYMYTLDGPAWRLDVSMEYVGDSLEIHPVNIGLGFGCGGACEKVWDTGFEFQAGVGAADASAVFSSTISDNQAGFASANFSATASSPLADHPSTITLLSARARCDSLFPNYPWACVFPDGPSQRFFVVAGYYPEATEHIVASQQWGAPGRDIALTRITDPAKMDDNRREACGRPARRPPRPPAVSCDEYPFASTREGAASHPGQGHTFSWCSVPPLLDETERPTAPWSACMIPHIENLDVGNDLYQFWATYRVIDGDKFFVEPT